MVPFIDRETVEDDQVWAGTALEFTLGHVGLETLLKQLKQDVR